MSSASTGAGVVATSGGAAAGAGGIAVAGNVYGDIINGNYNFKVNTNYGTLIYHAATPAVRLRDAVPQPPRAPIDFVDRADELAQLEQWIGTSQPVTLHGPEGVGKTTLLRQSANGEAARALPNGVVLLESIDFEGTLLKTDDIVQRLFDALYESTPLLKVTASTARTYLSNIRPLAILDNLPLPSTDAFRALIDLFPKSSVLFALPQLPGGNLTRAIKLGALPRAKALTLLASVSHVAIADANRPTLDAICDLLADVPLALITAANAIREKGLPLDQARTTLAAQEPTAADPLQAGIARAYALAYLTLSDEERKVLALVAASPGISVDAEWLRVTLDTAAWVDPAIERLKAQGLLHANSSRMRIDPGLRAFAQQGLDEAVLHERLITYLKAQLQTRALDWTFCADELGNILGSIEWAAQQNRWADVIVLSRAIDPYLTLHGLWDSWRIVLNRVLEGARATGDQAAEAWARHQLGTNAAGMGETNQAIRFLRRARDLRHGLGDAVAEAYTQHNLDILIPPVMPPTGHGGPVFGSLWWLILLLGALILVALLLAPIILNPPVPGTPQVQVPPVGLASASAVPRPSDTPKPFSTAISASTATLSTASAPTAALTPTLTFTLTPEPCSPPQGWVIYYIQPGDTLYSLAFNTGTTVQQLLEANCLDNGNYIVVGQGLYIPRVPPTRTFAATSIAPPRILSTAAKPTASSYRASTQRLQATYPCQPSIITFVASVMGPIGIDRVEIEYRYETGAQASAWLKAIATQSAAGDYEAAIDNNNADQAWRALQGLSGVIRWRAVATDSRGQSTNGDYQTIDITYCGSGPKPATDTPTPSPSGYIWSFIRPTSLPAEDPSVREGLFLAVDHDAIAKRIGATFDYRDVNGRLRHYPYDIAKANEYLATAANQGFKNLISISYYATDISAAQTARLMLDYFEMVGVQTQIIPESNIDPGNYTGDIVITLQP